METSDNRGDIVPTIQRPLRASLSIRDEFVDKCCLFCRGCLKLQIIEGAGGHKKSYYSLLSIML